MADMPDLMKAFGKPKGDAEEVDESDLPEFPKAGKDAAMADFLRAVKASDVKAMTDSLESFYALCEAGEEDKEPTKEG